MNSAFIKKFIDLSKNRQYAISFLKCSDINCNLSLIFHKNKKSNVVLDQIKKSSKHYNALTKLMEQMKKYPEYALIEYHDRVILSTALSLTKKNNVVEFYTGDGGLLVIHQVMKEYSIQIRYPNIVHIHK